MLRDKHVCMQGLYCSPHRQAGMVNVKQKRCVTEGCTNRPSFNNPGDHNPVFCSVHKLEGMVRPVATRLPNTATDSRVSKAFVTYSALLFGAQAEGAVRLPAALFAAQPHAPLYLGLAPGQTASVYWRTPLLLFRPVFGPKIANVAPTLHRT